MRSDFPTKALLAAFLAAALCFFFTYSAHAQSSFKNNFSILDSLSAQAADSVADFLKNRNITRSNISLSQHPAAWLLKEKFLKTAGVKFTPDTTAGLPHYTEVFIKDFTVRYFPYAEAPDSLIREGQIVLSGIISGSEHAAEPLPEISFKSHETIARSDIQFIEDGQYSFTHAPVPRRETTFWEEYGEPLLLISAAVITLALLFTVRSQ